MQRSIHSDVPKVVFDEEKTIVSSTIANIVSSEHISLVDDIVLTMPEIYKNSPTKRNAKRKQCAKNLPIDYYCIVQIEK